MKRSQVLLRTILFSSLTVVIYFFSQVPFLNLAALFLLPVPLALLGTMHGFMAVSLGVLIASILIGSFLGIASLVAFMPFGVCGFALGLCFHNKVGLKTSLTIAFALVGLSLWGQFRLGSQLLGVDHQLENRKFQESFSKVYQEQFLEPLRKDKEKVQLEYSELLGSLTTSVDERNAKKRELDQILTLEKSAVETKASLDSALKNQEPFLGFFLMVYLMIQVTIVKKIGSRLGVNKIPNLEFSSWKLPVGISWMFLALLVASIYLQQPGSELGADKDSLIAIGYAMQLVYFLFGISITSFLLVKLKISTPVKVFLLVLGFVFSQALVLMVMFLGIFDSFFNFRQVYADGKKGA